eukprot:CAMPEP_0117743262 /NCGR_PEP_ID=MMETSP0947-20121206/6030_1 /TAXON_ID=44440 /ORGANISM="Chattonella subsalsa, Strain CCMP2191" /LENGTH=108 /DNA_ID=CAMNT_0005559929 /DNA_START=34 /DNA_END=360 /DNA_ORIENTATION=-
MSTKRKAEGESKDEPELKRTETEEVKEEESKRKVLVTGGTGLVGKGIESFVSNDEEAKNNEEYIFLGSKDGDLNDKDDSARFSSYYISPGGVLLLYNLRPASRSKDDQ